MKVRTLVRLSKDYQVCETEIESEIPEQDFEDATKDYQNMCITKSIVGLQKALGQIKALDKKQEEEGKAETEDEVGELL